MSKVKLEIQDLERVLYWFHLAYKKKKPSNENKLGKRVVVGENAIVVPDRKKLDNLNSLALNQKMNPWSNSDLLPEEELVILKKKLEK